jgi:hypothetical protein
VRVAKKENVSRFMSELGKHECLLTEFDEGLWCEMVETMTIYSEMDVKVTFKDGSEVRVNLESE